MTRCLSDLELERLLRRPEGGASHALACPRCRARLAELRRLGEEFEREVFPATVEAVIAASSRPRRRRVVLWLAPLAAAAAAVIVLLRTGSPPDGYLGVKGPALTLVEYVEEGGVAHPLSDGEAVPAGAGVRFQVRPVRACRLWIVSVDAAGQVSRLYPPTGTEGASLDAGASVVLPGGAVLDDHPGPERFFAVCSPERAPLDLGEVERAARAVGGGEGRVRAVRTLPGLPADTAQASVLVEKRP